MIAVRARLKLVHVTLEAVSHGREAGDSNGLESLSKAPAQNPFYGILQGSALPSFPETTCIEPSTPGAPLYPVTAVAANHARCSIEAS